jgi:hypothetical protein
VFGYVRIVDTSGKVQRLEKGLYLKQIIMGMSGAGDLLALGEVVAPGGSQGVSHFGIFYNDSHHKKG